MKTQNNKISFMVLLAVLLCGSCFASASRMNYLHPTTIFQAESAVEINILYLEDVGPLADEAKTFLGDGNTTVFHASTKEDALSILRDNNINILLLDFDYSGIHGQNGVTFAKEVIDSEDISFSGKIIFYSESMRSVNREIDYLKIRDILRERYNMHIQLKRSRDNAKALAEIKRLIDEYFRRPRETSKAGDSTAADVSV